MEIGPRAQESPFTLMRVAGHSHAQYPTNYIEQYCLIDLAAIVFCDLWVLQTNSTEVNKWIKISPAAFVSELSIIFRSASAI